jgi:hypothetical protein
MISATKMKEDASLPQPHGSCIWGFELWKDRVRWGISNVQQRYFGKGTGSGGV